MGRAEVVYFHLEDQNFVLKHYYRGGLVASISKDQYFGFDIEKTRAFREWRLLKKMHALGLPVPEAVAARVVKSLFSYRADLITREIEKVKTLAELLTVKAIDTQMWEKIGACIKLFHQHDIYHADLNARNILLTMEEDIFLIDFDNSCFRNGADTWKMANLKRLKRSLLKFKKNEVVFKFNEACWAAFLQGYEGKIPL
ncbi:MAG: 3-deoxy-D-manno-octulosonic acid kinase [Gammaproteobacteria bacterium]|nr:3-deoxy-D-manno-octulosonic acid kinase [Gammaproteobacteria bacterium]